ncbi:hypothetical protein [Streptomyces sp. NPDC003943]
MSIRKKVITLTAATLVALGASTPAAMAGGNFGYNASRTTLSNGYLDTNLTRGYDTNHWNVNDYYYKSGGGTIYAQFGYSYHSSNHYGSWFYQSAGAGKSATWKDVYIADCQNLVGFMNVSGQGTFYNAPVTAC